MNKILFSIYRILVPKPIRTAITRKRLRHEILDLYGKRPEKDLNSDEKEVLGYLRLNPVSIFPYPFQRNYSPENVEVFQDHEKGLKYVFQEGKRLYFKRRWNKKRIQRSYSDLAREQDLKSPHRYLSDNFFPEKDEVIADIGAAEGNLSLSVIDKVKKIYLFEYDREWAEALKATFAPWSGKIEIVNKYVADFDDEEHIRLDTFFKLKNDITFLKIDVDGFEQKVLDGCREILSENSPLKIALCTYHKNDDEREFTSILQESNFSVSYSNGYMIHYYDKKIKAPWLRRGLIRAVRN